MAGRVYLNVPHEDKYDATELGCRWDPDRRQWSCIHLNTNFSVCMNMWGQYGYIERMNKDDEEDRPIGIRSPHAHYTCNDVVPSIINYLTDDQINKRAAQNKRAYEDSTTNYMNKFILTSGASSQPTQIDTQQPCTKHTVEEALPPLIYNTRSDMEHDEKVIGATLKRPGIILDEE